MKLKLLLLMFLMIVGIGTSEIKAQSLVVRMKDGTEYARNLDILQKFTFSNNNLLLKFINGSTESYSVLTISKLYFSLVSTGIENIKLIENVGTMSIYPNPADNLIYVQNIPEGISTVNIYRIDGLMVLRTQISSDSKSINISNLESGLYLFKVNDQAFKFIKL